MAARPAVVGACALALVACTAHDEGLQVEAVDHEGLERAKQPPPRPTRASRVERVEGSLSDADEVLAHRLLDAPEPDHELLLGLEYAYVGMRSRAVVEFCVDAEGEVLDMERGRGTWELVDITLGLVARMRFRPEPGAARVCGEYELRVRYAEE